MDLRLACALSGVAVSSLALAAEAPLEVRLSARWTAAYNSGDMAALGAMYAIDARLQQGYCPLVTGRDAIVAFWRGDLGDSSTKTHLEIEDTLSLDDAMYVSGSYAVEIAGTQTESARRVGGTYTQIWRHEEATGWTIQRETWRNLACAEVTVEPPADTDASAIQTTI
jgi:ketosteroid isomerase-like protein